VRLERLSRGQVLAAVAALALLLTMAMDWYGSKVGDEARRLESNAVTRGAEAGEVGRAVKADAQAVAEREERNAWQVTATIDRVITFLLLLAVVAALVAAVQRAAGRRSLPPWTPTLLAVGASLLGALLISYRVIQEPGVDDLTTVKIGPLLALTALAGIAIGSASAAQAEFEWAEMRETVRPSSPDHEAPQAG
jgi:drug/metabolite transporter (DMT)-like permease